MELGGRSVEKHSAGSELWVAGPGLLALYQGTTLVVPPRAKMTRGFRVCVRTLHLVPKGRLNTAAEFSAVPAGLPDDTFLTQDCVLGYFQTSLRD